MKRNKMTAMLPSGQGTLAAQGQNASWNMPPGDGMGGTSTNLNDMHAEVAGAGAKGHERHIKAHNVLHAPGGNMPVPLAKTKASGD
jgi:hypothetical protein